MFCFVITAHELGHFIFAKLTKIKVNEFAIGFGPKLLKFRKGETLYTIRAFPVGGFCAMDGDDNDENSDKSLLKKPSCLRG